MCNLQVFDNLTPCKCAVCKKFCHTDDLWREQMCRLQVPSLEERGRVSPGRVSPCGRMAKRGRKGVALQSGPPSAFRWHNAPDFFPSCPIPPMPRGHGSMTLINWIAPLGRCIMKPSKRLPKGLGEGGIMDAARQEAKRSRNKNRRHDNKPRRGDGGKEQKRNAETADKPQGGKDVAAPAE